MLFRSQFELLKDGPLTFRCTCSEERIKGTLKSLPEAEKQSLLADPSTEIVCPYCDKKYTIDRDTLSKWFMEGDHVQ